jgi:hypothetical protein
MTGDGKTFRPPPPPLFAHPMPQAGVSPLKGAVQENEAVLRPLPPYDHEPCSVALPLHDHTKVVEGETYHPSFWLAVMATAPTHCPSQRNMYWREFDEVSVAK